MSKAELNIQELKKMLEELRNFYKRKEESLYSSVQQIMKNHQREIEEDINIIISKYLDFSDIDDPSFELLKILYNSKDKELSRKEWDSACVKVGISNQGANSLFRWGYVERYKINDKRVLTEKGRDRLKELQGS